MHLKNPKPKFVNFYIAIFNIEDERKYTFWHIMLYCFKKGKNATETHTKMCAVCGEGAVTDQICQKWFVKFRAGNFSLDNVPQSVDQLKLITIKLRH